MGSLVSLLQKATAQIEPQVRSQLGGFFGGMVAAYLPQTWEFRTEREVAALTVDRSGRVTASEGAPPHPDVTLEGPEGPLAAALSSGTRSKPPPGTFTVTAHTAKGRTAFDFLRGRLGV